MNNGVFDVCECFSIKYTKSVIFVLDELVEKRIGRIMENTQSTIFHNGWIRKGCHYFDVFGYYMRPVSVLHHGVKGTEIELVITLFAMWSLAKEGSDPI